MIGIEIDGKREKLRFGSKAKAKPFVAELITSGHKVTFFKYSKDEIEAMTREAADREFMRLGTQYYIAARYVAWAGLLPVSGNLYHHAIEM
jgi:hypothetical protein